MGLLSKFGADIGAHSTVGREESWDDLGSLFMGHFIT